MTLGRAASGWTDLHNHVIPGVDDGAADPAAAAQAVAALGDAGVSTVVATPHIDGSITLDPAAVDQRLAAIDQGWSRLLAAVPGDSSPTLLRGAEVKLDVPQPDLSDPRLRLAGGPAVLVEFAYFMVPPRAEHTLGSLREAGYLPLLAHPERYHGTGKDMGVAGRWVAAGAYLQVNAGSLVGSYGKDVRRRAIELLERGWAHCIGSDYHARGRVHLSDAYDLLCDWNAEAQAEALLGANPASLARGEPCAQVQPLRRGSFLKRWARRTFGGSS